MRRASSRSPSSSISPSCSCRHSATSRAPMPQGSSDWTRFSADQHLRRVDLRRHAAGCRELGERRAQIAVVVERFDDRAGQRVVAWRQGQHIDLGAQERTQADVGGDQVEHADVALGALRAHARGRLLPAVALVRRVGDRLLGRGRLQVDVASAGRCRRQAVPRAPPLRLRGRDCAPWRRELPAQSRARKAAAVVPRAAGAASRCALGAGRFARSGRSSAGLSKCSGKRGRVRFVRAPDTGRLRNPCATHSRALRVRLLPRGSGCCRARDAEREEAASGIGCGNFFRAAARRLPRLASSPCHPARPCSLRRPNSRHRRPQPKCPRRPPRPPGRPRCHPRPIRRSACRRRSTTRIRPAGGAGARAAAAARTHRHEPMSAVAADGVKASTSASAPTPPPGLVLGERRCTGHPSRAGGRGLRPTAMRRVGASARRAS